MWRDSSVNMTNISGTLYSGTTRYQTNKAPDGSYTLNIYSSGLLSSSTRYQPNGTQLMQTTLTYDTHGRQSASADARNGTTKLAYNNADQVVTSTTPSPSPEAGAGAQVTTMYYDTSLRNSGVRLPDNTTVTNQFDPMGMTCARVWFKRVSRRVWIRRPGS